MRIPPLLAAAAISLLAPATLAQASADPLASGTTKLTLDRGFLSLLRAHGVKLLALSPATRKGSSITLPVSGGQIDPTTSLGTIEQEGSVLLVSAKHSLPLRRLVLKTESSPLIAKVGGGQLKVATSTKRSFAREGFGADFSARELRLTQKAAVRLDKKLHLRDVFAEGQLIGRLKARTQPLTVTLKPTGKLTFSPDPDLLAKLRNLHVSLNPIAPAELAPGPIFSFPIIAKGAIAPDATMGTLRSGGSIEALQLGGGQIFWHELWLDLGAKLATAELDAEPSPPYQGRSERPPLLDLDMGAATISSDPRARTITVTGLPATLGPQIATAFDEAFAKGKGEFKPGDPLGTFSFAAQGQ